MNIKPGITCAFLLGIVIPAPAPICEQIPSVIVPENAAVLRIELRRTSDLNTAQSVEFQTFDGPGAGWTPRQAGRPASAGVDYLARSGTAVFGVGQTVTGIEVPLVDNAIEDGPRDFHLSLTNPSPGLVLTNVPSWIQIEDNELSPQVHPFFPQKFYGTDFLGEMPDGRILISSGYGMTMLRADGSVDRTFKSPPGLVPREVLPDGRIWATAPYLLLRLLPNGSLEAEITSPYIVRTAVLPDGGLVVLARNDDDGGLTVRKLKLDGTVDQEFQPGELQSDPYPFLALQADGKILIAGRFNLFNGECHPNLIRLNSDGSLDSTFLPVGIAEQRSRPVVRANGKIILHGHFTALPAAAPIWPVIVQLNEDGSVDTGFSPLVNSDYAPVLEQPDGRVVLVSGGSFLHNELGWLSNDGSFAPPFGVHLKAPPLGCVGQGYFAALALTAGGDLLFSADFTNVNGFPRPGLVRLLTRPAARDFRVVAPAEFYRSDGVARVRLVRTGDTVEAATVEYATLEETAKAGEDFIAQAGRLTFAPLEVRKEIAVPLLPNARAARRVSFVVQLDSPSTGYTTQAPAPIGILAGFWLEIDRDGPLETFVTLHGARPGTGYWLEGSSDLEQWQPLNFFWDNWLRVERGSGHGFYYRARQQ